MTHRYHISKTSLIVSFILIFSAFLSIHSNAQLVTGIDTLKIESGQWQYYDFTASKAFPIADTATYTPDIWGSSNEGVNFGKEFSALIPSRRIQLLGTGDIDTVTTVPTWTDAAPWVDTSWDFTHGTLGQPISPDQLWVVYTSEGLYVVMQIDELPNGNFGDSFTFKFKYMSEGGTTLEESNLNDNAVQSNGSATISFGEGFDFSREEIGDNNDAGDYQLDFAFVSNEGVNFGNEGSSSLTATGRRFLLIGNGSLDTLTTVPEQSDAAPWVTVSYDFSDGTGGLPISVGQLWAVFTREGNYAAMEITALPDGDFGNSFDFKYKYQPGGSRYFESDSTMVSNEGFANIPQSIELSQNYPNPFNPATQIEYSLNSDTQVSLEVFDISGRLVRTLVNKRQTIGVYAVTFDAQNLSTGVYIYRLKVGATHITKKMLLIK